jgi:hypothetical protein
MIAMNLTLRRAQGEVSNFLMLSLSKHERKGR